MLSVRRFTALEQARQWEGEQWRQHRPFRLAHHCARRPARAHADLYRRRRSKQGRVAPSPGKMGLDCMHVRRATTPHARRRWWDAADDGGSRRAAHDSPGQPPRAFTKQLAAPPSALPPPFRPVQSAWVHLTAGSLLVCERARAPGPVWGALWGGAGARLGQGRHVAGRLTAMHARKLHARVVVGPPGARAAAGPEGQRRQARRVPR